MECEFCGLEGNAGEASVKCSECSEWVCEEHSMVNAAGSPLCSTCFEAAAEGTPLQDLGEDIQEYD